MTQSNKPSSDSTRERYPVQFHRSNQALLMGTSRIYPKPTHH